MFRENDVMKNYIDKNTNLKAKGKNNYEKFFFTCEQLGVW